MMFEYINGRDLYYYIINNYNISEKDNIFVLNELCSAINYLHNKGLIYIDLKPENIMLIGNTLTDGIKLIDFGSVEKINSESTGKYRIITKGYCSPEIYYRNRFGYGTDIWSLGVISFTIHHQYMPYDIKLYNRNIHVSRWPKITYKKSSKEAKDLWHNMLKMSKNKRYCLKDVMNHIWLNYNRLNI
jgi:serine/threonine protein kinase